MTNTDEQIKKLYLAELQFSLTSAVWIASNTKQQPIDILRDIDKHKEPLLVPKSIYFQQGNVLLKKIGDKGF